MGQVLSLGCPFTYSVVTLIAITSSDYPYKGYEHRNPLVTLMNGLTTMRLCASASFVNLTLNLLSNTILSPNDAFPPGASCSPSLHNRGPHSPPRPEGTGPLKDLSQVQGSRADS